MPSASRAALVAATACAALAAPAAVPAEPNPYGPGPVSPYYHQPRAKPARAGCAAASPRPMRTARRAYAAVAAARRVPAYRRPGRGRIARFRRVNQNGVPMVFGVLGVVRGDGCRTAWYRVQLPTRPNGLTGYVRARDVRVVPVRARVVVDLSRRTVALYRAGRRVLVTRAAIGTRATPTPTGRYYVNQRLLARSSNGPFGPGAIGISAFSDVLQGWAQGGPIAIHGTNQPWLIGQAVSHGCVRVPNRVIRRFFREVPAGTPVEVRA